VIAGALLLGGCTTLGYYGQAAVGQMRLLAARRDVDAVLADPATGSALAADLRSARTILAFAREHLGLAVEDRYRAYVELDREAVLWNVVAAPRDAVAPVQWCFPVAGCVSYRGYFREADARAAAARFAADGLDVHVGPVAAYSTLGWFDDPLLSTFVDRPPADLAELLFHELAHGLVYVPGETAFNESFATFYAREGVRRWLAGRDPALRVAWEDRLARRARFVDHALAARAALEAGYAAARAEGLSAAAFEARRAALWAGVRARWRAARPPALAPWDPFFLDPPSNARLAAVADYAVHVPRFARLLADCDDDLGCLRAAVRALAEDDAARARFVAGGDPGEAGAASELVK
jgi:predicted aminopeptidase